MQTSKLFLVICAVTLFTGVSILRADETEAQKKAREALRQKWQELDGQRPPAAPPVTAAPATTPRAVAPATPPPVAPAAVPRSADSEAQAKALEALRQKYNEGQGQQPGAAVTGTASSQPLGWNPNAPDNAAQAKAREALWLKWKELDAHQPVAPPMVTPGAPAIPTVAFKPIEPPPSPISGSKSGKLAELLRQYRADQISPADYHKQRAAILAEK